MAEAEETARFEEKQYLGFNIYSTIRRTVIALFCFLAYYFSINSEEFPATDKQANILFMMGVVTLMISIFLMFILHLHTKVHNGFVELDGLWTARKVKIDLHSIVAVKKVRYNQYMLNRPVYNLHLKGTVKFYTRGSEAVRLTDKSGLKYVIGSQQAANLYKAIQEELQQTKHHKRIETNENSTQNS